MSDWIHLQGMVFEGRHGVSDEERELAQPIEVDAEMSLDLGPAGMSDDLARTVDYGDAFDVCRDVVENRSFHLLEGIAEAIATELLARFELLEEVRVKVKKPGVPRRGIIDHAGVSVDRRRTGGG
jgi:dihydroneopterin aldolase